MTPQQRQALEAARARLGKAEPAPQPEAAPEADRTMLDALEGGVARLGQGVTMGWGDNLTGLASALMFPREGQNFSENAAAAAQRDRDMQLEFDEANPYLGPGLEMGGAIAQALLAGNAGATLTGKGGSLTSNVGRGMLEGGAYGALYGAGSRDDDPLVGGLYGAGGGAAAGGVLSGGASAIGKIRGNNRAAATAPTSKEMLDRGGALLEEAKQANPAFAGFDDYVMDVYRQLGEDGIDDILHPKLSRWVNKLEELSTGGTAPTYRQLDTLRKQLGPALSDFNNVDQQRLAMSVRGALDRFMEQGRPAPTAMNVFADDIDHAVPAPASRNGMAQVREGRELYRRGKNMRRVEDAAYKAELDTATSGSGGNIDNNIRREVKRMLLNDKTRARLKPAEIAELEEVVRGGPVENALRLVGKLSPQGNGLMFMLTGVGPAAAAGATGNPLLMAPAGIGMVAKALGDATTRSKVKAVGPVLASGGRARPITGPTALSPQMRAIIDAMSAQGGGLAATAP